MSSDVNQRINRVVAAVLGVPPGAVTDATSSDTITGWDSLAHIQLVIALQSEFALSFTPEQALGMTSVQAIKGALRALGVSGA